MDDGLGRGADGSINKFADGANGWRERQKVIPDHRPSEKIRCISFDGGLGAG